MRQSVYAQHQIKPWVYSFINEFISNGFNQTRAMLAVKPHIKPQTACTAAKMLLQTPEIEAILKAEVAKREEEQEIQNISRRETLIKEAEEVRKLAKTSSQPQLKHMLGAIDLKGRLAGAFDQQTNASEQIQSFIGKLQINNTQINVGVDKSRAGKHLKSLSGNSGKVIDCIGESNDHTDKLSYVKYNEKNETTE